MAGFPKYVWIKGKRLYLYDTFIDRNKAFLTAKYYQRKLKNNYFILVSEGFWSPNRRYGLYMNKVMRL